MNPGYLTFILMCIVAILCASGWKDVFLKGVPYPALLLFFIGWAASWLWPLPEFAGQRLHGCVVPLAACVVWTAARIRGWLERFHMISVGLLLASIYYVMQMIGQLDPIVLLPHAGLETALLLGAVAAAAVHRPVEQIGAICLGTLIGEAMYWHANEQWLPRGLFGKTFQDTWWLTLIANRGCAVALQVCGDAAKQLQRWWLSGKEEEDER